MPFVLFKNQTRNHIALEQSLTNSKWLLCGFLFMVLTTIALAIAVFTLAEIMAFLKPLSNGFLDFFYQVPNKRNTHALTLQIPHISFG